LSGKPGGKKPLEGPTTIWEDIIEMGIKQDWSEVDLCGS
jgi:hypothetical protein